MSFCGTGGWTGPKPGDPDNNSVLTATPTFGGIDIAFTYPATNPHAVAYTKLYRGITTNFGEAIHSVVLHGNTYYDKLDSGTQYWYWIQIVSVNGTVGDVIGPATAVARPLINDLIAQLTGAIDSGLLAQSLRTEIDKITLNYGDLIGRLQSVSGDNAALSQALANVQQGIAEALALIIDERSIRQSGQTALIEQIDAIAALNEENAAAILVQEEASVSRDAANAQRIEEVLATVNDSLAAAVQTLNQAIADNNGAMAQQLSTAQTTLENQIAGVQTTLQANIDTVGDTVTEIGALYNAKLSVNGLVGGFGVYNDGTEVEAGFDVDRFWVGRTGPDKKKPFIIQDDEVFINEAAINQLTITKLRDESGRLVVENGGLAIRDAQGNIIFSAGTPLDWSLVSGTNKPQDGATRNVNKGAWATATAYDLGDIVTYQGSSWSCKLAHVSVLDTSQPPALPTTQNTYWELWAAKGESGINGLTIVVSNEAHTLPASSSGVVSDYAGSGTTIQVFEGATALNASASATTGAFRIGTITQSPELTITVGGVSYADTTVTVDHHSAMVDGTDSVVLTIPVTIYRANGTSVTVNKIQTLSKSKTGSTGADGAQGPAVVLVSDRPASFTSTDGNLDASQANIVFTANVFGITSPTYAWSFSGLQTNPTASTTNTQTITAAQFGTSKSAIVTVTVNGTIVDKMTIVRLERSTAEAGATVGADNSNFRAGAGINLIPNASLLNSISPWASYINTGAGRSGSFGLQVNANGAPKGYGSAYLSITGPVPSDYDDSLHTGSFKVPCAPGERIELQAKVQVFRGNARLECAFFDSNGNPILFTAASNGVIEAVGDTAWSTNLADFVHLWGFVAAPANAASVYLEVRVKRTTTSMNTDLYVTQPYIGKATANQSGPTQWTNSQPYITSGNASTYIANAAIGSAQIGSLALVGTGNFSVKTAVSGARMEMDSRAIKVYDATGVLRVQLGDLLA